MNLEEFRVEMESCWRDALNEATSFKDPYLALDRLQTLYRRFNPDERAMADTVLGEWALSDDEVRRSYTLALIDDFKIKAALASLQKLIELLSSDSGPGAPYELEKVRRIVQEIIAVSARK